MIKETRLLFDALTKGKTAEQIVSMAQKKLLHNPVLITNSFFKVIAMSSDVDFSDPVWDNAKLHGRMSKEHNELFSIDPASERLFEQGSSFLYDTGLGAKIPRILGKIHKQNKTVGYIVVFQVNSKLTEKDVKISHLVCQALSVVLTGDDNISFISKNNMEYFLRELLIGSESDNFHIENEVSHRQWLMKTNFRAIHAGFINENKKNREYIPYILETLNAISPQQLVSFEHQQFIFILYNYEINEERVQFEHQIKTIIEKHKLRLGQSRSFSSIGDLRIYYEQAKRAFTLGNILSPTESFHRFSKYSYFALISKMKIEELRGMQCKEYRIINKYDMVHETSFIETLIAFFLNNTNMNTTAKELHIHRNTLTYRLNRIQEILQVESLEVLSLMSIYNSNLIETWITSRSNRI